MRLQFTSRKGKIKAQHASLYIGRSLLRSGWKACSMHASISSKRWCSLSAGALERYGGAGRAGEAGRRARCACFGYELSASCSRLLFVLHRPEYNFDFTRKEATRLPSPAWLQVSSSCFVLSEVDVLTARCFCTLENDSHQGYGNPDRS